MAKCIRPNKYLYIDVRIWDHNLNNSISFFTSFTILLSQVQHACQLVINLYKFRVHSRCFTRSFVLNQRQSNCIYALYTIHVKYCVSYCVCFRSALTLLSTVCLTHSNVNWTPVWWYLTKFQIHFYIRYLEPVRKRHM